MWDTHGRVHPSNQMCPWKSAHTFNQTFAKPEFDNLYLIKGTFRQASFEAQMLHHFYYITNCKLYHYYPVHNKVSS